MRGAEEYLDPTYDCQGTKAEIGLSHGGSARQNIKEGREVESAIQVEP